MAKSKRMSEAARNATIERAEFDAVMTRLIHSKPISKEEIAAKVKREGRAVSRSSNAEKRLGQQ